jgi:predicted Rossmann fold flavoprotein
VVEYELAGAKSREIFDKIVLSGGGMFRMFSQNLIEQQIYSIPANLQHTTTNVRPSLSPIRIKNNPFKSLSGTAMSLQLISRENKIKMEQDAIFTHAGISGPVVLDFSAYLPSSGEFFINFIPQITEEDFFAGFSRLRQGKNLFRKYLREFLPKKVADWHLDSAGITLTTNIADISKDKVKMLRKNLFNYPVSGAETYDYSACWTTKGGVPLSEINVATMESKIHPNLFFAGEILDVNGLCGGYNISFAAISAKILSEKILQK